MKSADYGVFQIQPVVMYRNVLVLDFEFGNCAVLSPIFRYPPAHILVAEKHQSSVTSLALSISNNLTIRPSCADCNAALIVRQLLLASSKDNFGSVPANTQ